MATQVLGQSGGNSLFPGGANIGMALSNDMYDLHDLSKAELAAPQLIMLANVALTGEVNGNCCDYLVGEERQMAELTTVGDSNFSDSDGEGMEDTHAAESDHEAPENVELSSLEVPSVETQDAASCPPPKTPSVDKDVSLEAPGTPESTEDKCKNLKSKPFRCKPCQYEAESEEEFVHHIRVHSAKKFFVEENAEKQAQVKESDSCTAEEVDFSKGPIRCDRCGYNTNRYDHYLAHLKHHNKAGENERVYKCTICTYTTVSEYHWKKHLRNHFPRKVYTCSQCSYFSDRKNNYIQHIRTHTGEKPFKCDQCSYVASNQHEVTRHARQVHNGPKPLTCPHCDYKTADRSNFKKHVELHVNPRQFLCPVCDYAASKKCNLQYHIKSRHPDCSDITMDVSKVKLRTKKSEADFSESINDKAEKEQMKGDSAAKKTEKIVKVEKKDNLAKEKKPMSNVSAGQVTTRSRKSASENKEVDIKTEKNTEKTCKTKKIKRKAEAEVNSSKQEPVNDTSTIIKKKKKVEAKPRDCQEAQKSDVVPEEDPKKQNSCLKKNRKKKALKNKHGKKSGKLDQEKIEEEEMPDECYVMEEDGCMKPDTEGSDQKEQDPTDTAALNNDIGHALKGESTDPKGSCMQDPGQLCLPAQDANTEDEVQDQEMLPAAGEGEDTVGEKEERKADRGEDACSEESSHAASPEKSLDVPMDVVPDLAPEKEPEETFAAETVSNSDLMDLTKTCLPAPEPTEDAVPAPAPPEACTQSPKVALALSSLDNTAVNESQEMDEDEGIHSHEGSDISDNISEGSDDSGLNGARSIQEETSPKASQGAADTTVARENYVCIFCDRSFKKEGEYSKHLNRHLVNVYYLEKATKGQE
uniref:RE1 silencing transcription factor n=1 Tax=Accipiter nisus TaxID=211598 RepID=A0A8B9M2F0_9AVES